MELDYSQVRKRVQEDFIKCRSTAELLPLTEILGQDRAVRAIKFGLEIKERGFNIYVAGPPGTGRKTATTNFLSEIAKSMPTPSDWCYVNNFEDPLRPNALRIPAGKGRRFKKDMDKFIEDMKSALSKAFESEEYGKRKKEVLEIIEREGNELSKRINEKAQKEGFILQRSPIGLLMIPVVEGKALSEQEILTLSEKLRRKIEQKRSELEESLRLAFKQLRDLEKKADQAIEELNRDIANFALEPLLKGLMDEYGEIPEVKEFLKNVQKDILNNLENILRKKRGPEPPFPSLFPQEDPTKRYRVNLLVDNSNTKGAPVIMEINPNYYNLFGKIEKEAQFGILTTDYTMIRCGSAHRALGGFLVIPVEDLLMNPYAWDALKYMIMNEQLEIEEIGERFGLLTTKTLKPEPIPFDAKVILIGRVELYHLLYNLDLNFRELFKVKADFDITMEKNEENIRKYASFICSVCMKENLKHMDSSGISEILEYSSRLASNQDKLSTWFANIADVIREANFYATKEGAELISKHHVVKTLEERVYRSNLIQKKIEEMIEKGILLIDTESEKVGQVNGLSVVSLGDYEFGRPSRVTATVGLGREGIIDIERESKMGGPIHTKGVLIISGLLSERYAQEKPLSLNARLVFEQSYTGVEGDSASSTELYAILSTLSGKPIKQYLAVTGSINQKGEVQAIGGINEKIEGFFEVCKMRGLNGRQGVVIPWSNIKNLMLKEEVVEAVKNGTFHIYPVKNIDEGIEILTGVKAGKKLADGTYEEGSINDLVQKRLFEMAEKVKEYIE
ncbi:MAG: AAA family ATPase [Candidatus Bathyarchaeia archaeon]